MSKPIDIGKYRMGWRWVLLRANPDSSDGSCCFAPDEPKITTMTVGIRGPWPMTVATLLHEAIETAISEFELRYRPVGQLSGSSAGNLIVMTHCQFSEVSDRAGDFMANTMPALRRAWAANRRKKK